MSRVRIAHVTTIPATLVVLLMHQLQAIRNAGFDVVGVSAPGPEAAILKQAGIEHYAVPSLSRRRDPLADLRALLDLTLLFRREHFTIVHTHMPKTGVLGRFAARLAGTPLILNTVHGPYGLDRDRGLRRWFYLTLERLAAAASDFELAQGRETFDLFTSLGIFQSDRSAHLGNGIDLQYFDPAHLDATRVAELRRELHIPPGASVIGTVGRLTWDKGYREFLMAHELVRVQRSAVVFVACGPSDEREPLPVRVIEEATAKGVRFLGFRSDMREIYALMDIFVLPSYHEGFPRAAMEAAAMGKALVLTDIRGCREVVTHGRDGLLVPVRQPAAVAQAIVDLLGNATLRKEYGEASRRRALVEFDERRVFDRVIKTYQRLLPAEEGVEADVRLHPQSVSRR